MTKLPTDSWAITPFVGDMYPRYKCSSICSVPGCSKFSDHIHHIARRSFVIGDVSWVRYGDGPIVGNLTGLCWMHHNDVTDGRARIAYIEEEFVYLDNIAGNIGPIFPQPPVHGTRVTSHAGQEPIGPAHAARCPACKRTLPREQDSKTEKKRRRKTWTVTVPDDSQEDGAIVLDTLLDSCRDGFGHSEGKKMRYFTLVQALALVVQNIDKLTSDG